MIAFEKIRMICADLRVLSETGRPEDRQHTGRTGQIHVDPGLDDTVRAATKHKLRRDILGLRKAAGLTRAAENCTREHTKSDAD